MKHLTIIVPVSHVAIARNIGDATSIESSGMYQRGCCQIGSNVVTHYISSGQVLDDCFGLLQSPQNMFGLAQSVQLVPLTCTLDDVIALAGVIDISEEDAEVALERLGLKLEEKAL